MHAENILSHDISISLSEEELKNLFGMLHPHDVALESLAFLTSVLPETYLNPNLSEAEVVLTEGWAWYWWHWLDTEAKGGA